MHPTDIEISNTSPVKHSSMQYCVSYSCKNGQRRISRRKTEEEAEENPKNTPPSFLQELLSAKNHPPKKVCGPYIKFVNLMCDTGQSPLSSLFEKRKQPTSKKKVYLLKNSGVMFFVAEKERDGQI